MTTYCYNGCGKVDIKDAKPIGNNHYCPMCYMNDGVKYEDEIEDGIFKTST